MSVYLLDPTSCFAISLNISSTPSPVLHEVLYTPEIRLLHCSHSVSMSESETCILDLRSYLLPQLSKKLVQCLNLCSDTKYCSSIIRMARGIISNSLTERFLHFQHMLQYPVDAVIECGKSLGCPRQTRGWLLQNICSNWKWWKQPAPFLQYPKAVIWFLCLHCLLFQPCRSYQNDLIQGSMLDP